LLRAPTQGTARLQSIYCSIYQDDGQIANQGFASKILRRWIKDRYFRSLVSWYWATKNLQKGSAKPATQILDSRHVIDHDCWSEASSFFDLRVSILLPER
jgi:hypothetical protein